MERPISMQDKTAIFSCLLGSTLSWERVLGLTYFDGCICWPWLVEYAFGNVKGAYRENLDCELLGRKGSG